MYLRPNFKSNYIRYDPKSITNANTANEQMFIDIPREDSVISLKHCNLESDFDLKLTGTDRRFPAADNIRLIDLGSIA